MTQSFHDENPFAAIFNFTHDDLQANRNWELTPRQRETLPPNPMLAIGCNITLMAFLIGLTAGVFAAILAYTVGQSLLNAMGIMVIFVAGAIVFESARQQKLPFEKRKISVYSKRATVYKGLSKSGQYLLCAANPRGEDDHCFYVTDAQYNAITDEMMREVYFYYIRYPQHLLSMEYVYRDYT